MKRRLLSFLLITGLIFWLPDHAMTQCSICTRTAQQMGEKPAKALNGAIIYLAAAPLLVIGFIGYRWWKQNR